VGLINFYDDFSRMFAFGEGADVIYLHVRYKVSPNSCTVPVLVYSSVLFIGIIISVFICTEFEFRLWH
jgi:hypothetical protein